MHQHLNWTAAEKKIARKAFELAYRSECQAILEETRGRLASIKDATELWEWHDELGKKRRDLDGKYDYRYSQLIQVFGVLLAEGRLTMEQLAGLDAEKLSRIETMGLVVGHLRNGDEAALLALAAASARKS